MWSCHQAGDWKGAGFDPWQHSPMFNPGLPHQKKFSSHRGVMTNWGKMQRFGQICRVSPKIADVLLKLQRIDPNCRDLAKKRFLN